VLINYQIYQHVLLLTLDLDGRDVLWRLWVLVVLLKASMVMGME